MRYTPTTLAEQIHRLARSLEVSAAIDDFRLSGDNAAFSAWLDANACPPGVIREPRPTDRPVSASRLGEGSAVITWHVAGDVIVGLPAGGASRDECYSLPVAALRAMPEVRCVVSNRFDSKGASIPTGVDGDK